MEVGIVGLPNVGKSSLFNALTKAGAQASNFPFTTIKPNVGVVSVPDERLDFLAEKYKSAKVVPAIVKFVDIAGLVKGASKGEGLGNQFLSHIRACDAIVEVVRCFKDPNVVHVHGRVNPDGDISTINTELLLADLEQARKALDSVAEKVKKQEKEALKLKPLLEKAVELFDKDLPLRTDPALSEELKQFQFLSAKPLLYVANVDETTDQTITEQINTHANKEKAKVLAINVKTESEIVDLPDDEQNQFRLELRIKSSLNEMIRACYGLLGLITFFTAGPTEAHAWTITKGTKAPQAAGKIHTDFERGFIRVEVFSVADLQELGSEKTIREHGKLRSEGKEYIFKDGDVVEFLFNV
ncbi:MAG TPA: redox-regulated ATPase YchF [Candidatus Saccharimonadales bacterium]|nr:redox-regulated ATPase YchF [Candidatus Saccharimonadales bacterium]